MNSFPQENGPYITGSYDYYPEDANVFAFDNNHGAALNHGSNNLWFADPCQAVYANQSENFVFDSNPPMVSVANNDFSTGIDKHYDNPSNISSWISTSSPTGYVYQFNNAISSCSQIPGAPMASLELPADGTQNAAFFPGALSEMHTGSFAPLSLVNPNFGWPMYPSSAVSFSSPYTRVISTSTSASSCPGSSSTLATPRFDPSSHFAPLQPPCEETRYLKSRWPNPLTPETSDVFTTVPLRPPPIKQSSLKPRPEGSRLPGQSPVVATFEQASSMDVPRQSVNGRSLRSTPSIESLQDYSPERDIETPNESQTLMSPFATLAPDSLSMSRTYSAPCSFLNHNALETPTRRESRQLCGNRTSPFTTEPLMASSNTTPKAKVAKQKPSLHLPLQAQPMMRSVTSAGLSISPLWDDAWSPASRSKVGTAAMIRSVSFSDLAQAATNMDSANFALNNVGGWTSQVPQLNRPGIGLQAVEADSTSCTNAFTSIPTLTVLSADDSSPFSTEPRHLTVPGTGIARPTKKLPKRAQTGPKAMKLTFMNLGPNDGKEITNAVAESGKSKRNRQDDASSGEDTVGKIKRIKSQASHVP